MFKNKYYYLILKAEVGTRKLNRIYCDFTFTIYILLQTKVIKMLTNNKKAMKGIEI